MTKQNQRELVLAWLEEYGTITTREAVTELNIMALPRRIFELKAEGYPIIKTWRITAAGTRFGEYSLKREA